jgi:peptidoglycan/LPS O-acetylase OafA/YrhL
LLRLRRITSGASWIPQIDGLRFVAIMSVLFFHLGGQVIARGPKPLGIPMQIPWVHWLVIAQGNGDRGVVLFFVISGYILARPFLREHRLGGHKVKLGSYFLRRLTRLEPPYILSLLLYTFAWCAVNHVALRTLLPHLLASLMYLHNLIYARMSDISFVTWSLEVEVQFYVLAPLLGNLYRIQPTALRRGVIVALMVVMGFVSIHLGEYLHMTLLGYAHYFLAGFLLADLLEYPRHTSRQTWAWDLVSVAGWAAIFYLPKDYYQLLGWLPLVIVPTYLAAFYGKASNWFFRQPFVALTGGMCYSIYLLHMLVISTVFRVIKYAQLATDGETILLQIMLMLPVTLIVGAIYFVLVERPCMDPQWPQKLWHKLGGTHKDEPTSAQA